MRQISDPPQPERPPPLPPPFSMLAESGVSIGIFAVCFVIALLMLALTGKL